MYRPQNPQTSHRIMGGAARRTINFPIFSFINPVSSDDSPTDFFQFPPLPTMKVSLAIAEILSDFSGFQRLHSSTAATSSAPSASTMSSECSRHSLNITVGVQQVNQITRSASSNSLNDFQCLHRKSSSASYLVIE